MTGRDEENDCMEGFSVGADDYITKPVSPKMLYARLGVAKRILTIQEELRSQREQLRESRDLVSNAYDIVWEDIEAAAAIQKSQLPINGLLTQSISSAWCYRPAKGISGDYLDIFQVSENRLFFYLLDVSGHGVAAALRSAAISHLLRPMSGLLAGLEDFGPAHVISCLNRQLCASNQEIDYLATLVMGDLDASTGLLRLASAGHPSPLLLKKSEDAVAIEAGGLPLGIDPTAIYSHEEIRLDPSDSLLIFSDGLMDCENRKGQQYGMDALRKRAEQFAGLELPVLLSQLETGVDEWRDDTPITDDLSLLLLRFTPATLSVASNAAGTELMPKPVNQKGSLSLSSDANEVESLLDRINSVLGASCLDEMLAFHLSCAIVEAVNNCIQHAYQNETGQPIEIIYELMHDRVRIKIADKGIPFEVPTDAPEIALLDESGRGLSIISAWVSQLQFGRKNGWNECLLEQHSSSQFQRVS